MDSTSLREAILADYIGKIQDMTRKELLQELIELKYRMLESCSDSELINHQYAKSRKQKI